ncbi:MAG TPA: hypothetical protein VFM46_15605, partial [Pseudomonadales bacterium]|nr:hypothetical protein [Pseudomonadales bacterium]
NLHTTIEKANKTMDALLANERKAVGKEYSNFPETFIPYAKAFQQATGIKPSSKEKMDWLSTIQDWINAGYQPDDVTAAVKAIVSDGRMAINRPGSITWKLRAMAMRKTPEYQYEVLY